MQTLFMRNCDLNFVVQFLNFVAILFSSEEKTNPLFKGHCSLEKKTKILTNISFNRGHAQVLLRTYLNELDLLSKTVTGF